MFFAGQNKYFGTIEESTKFWKELGLNHLMIKPDSPNFELIDEQGRLQIENIKKLSKQQREFEVEYHFHPYNMKANKKIMQAASTETNSILEKMLKELDQAMQDYGFYDLITLHISRVVHPKYNINMDEEETIQRSADFFQNLNLKTRIALETMYDPYMNLRSPGTYLLGNKPEHFKRVIGQEKNIGICIDIGHLNMSRTSVKEITDLPYPIYSVHLHGNDMQRDTHLLPYYETIRDFEGIIDAIKICEGPVVIELSTKFQPQTKQGIKNCLEFWERVIEV
ncbi:MAG: sugar phosphate isomerase/epimerase [Nanoarchaeota archaeon]|nr:sugar phosphate isomerase/epimerase [Nanoarchaeota archaeon]MBU1321862.1 sugar phosphate isomerase/epimerase [Nanoarchaeota archaeon]MBU1597207.1 sugar phosphate isomerase/epimerase [Nanoarchaeota archaeon]MBU2441906.1 sugar phosphate isomerase/epimerase [Nanoarchaeota archaeon]